MNCPYCLKSFKALKDHIKNVHSENQFVCSYEGCNKSFGKKHGLNRHMKTHSDNLKPYHCPVCFHKFVEKIQLERHFQIHLKAEKKSEHQCLNCLKYFNRKPDLWRHNKTVHETKLYECDLCPSRRFGSKFEVLHHIRTVHWGEKTKRRKPTTKIPFKVIMSTNPSVKEKFEARPKETRMKSNKTKTPMKVILESVEPIQVIKFRRESIEYIVEQLDETSEITEIWVEPIQIVTTHHGKSKAVQWECQRCDQIYESCERLKLHNIRNHNWRCKLCPSDINTITSFYRKEDFELHWMENHGNQQFPDKSECSICLDMFANKSALNTHQKNEHGIQLPKRIRKNKIPIKKSCKHCQEEFKSPSSLEKHLIQVHRDRKLRKCFTCNLQFELFSDFRNHVESHGNEFVCLVCGGMPFEDGRTLRAHRVVAHYRCPEVKAWKCDLCHRSFHCKSLINRHMIEAHQQDEGDKGRVYSLKVHGINDHGKTML